MKKYLTLLLLFLAINTFAGDVRISAGGGTTPPPPPPQTTQSTSSSWWSDFCSWVDSVI